MRLLPQKLWVELLFEMSWARMPSCATCVAPGMKWGITRFDRPINKSRTPGYYYHSICVPPFSSSSRSQDDERGWTRETFHRAARCVRCDMVVVFSYPDHLGRP